MIILGLVEHLIFLHLDIKKLLGSRLHMLVHTLGVGFTLRDLENYFSGLLGSLPVTLLHTSTSSLVPRLPLSFSHLFSCANITCEKSKERENLVRNRTHPWPPWPAMAVLMAATCSIVHSIALTLPCGS